jgi:hypothetical protein
MRSWIVGQSYVPWHRNQKTNHVISEPKKSWKDIHYIGRIDIVPNELYQAVWFSLEVSFASA